MGDIKINITAATLVLKALVSIFGEINQSLEAIQQEVQTFSFYNARSFIVSYSQLDPFETLILHAIQAPNDDLFYLNPFSNEWENLHKVMVDVKI